MHRLHIVLIASLIVAATVPCYAAMATPPPYVPDLLDHLVARLAGSWHWLVSAALVPFVIGMSRHSGMLRRMVRMRMRMLQRLTALAAMRSGVAGREV